MSRRSRAVLIRVRQEVAKHLERVTPGAAHGTPGDATALLCPDARTRVRRGASLREVLAAGAAQRFPLVHLACREGAPPDAEAVVTEARAVLDGDWSIFGQRADAFAQSGDWLADPIDGRPWPMRHWTRVPFVEAGRDVKQVWELNRHHGLVRLAQAYHLTGDEAFADSAVRLLAAWALQNPPRQGVNWTASLEVAFRAIAWCWIWQLTHRSAAWTEERTARFACQLWHHARYVEQYDSIHHSPNTHLTGEALGLLYVGATFPALRRAARWRRFGTAILLDEIPHQFLADGFHYERATGYHRYHLEFYAHALLLLRGEPTVPTSKLATLTARLRDGFAAAAALQRPDGGWPVFGDEDGGSTIRLATAPATDLCPLLTLGAALHAEPMWLWGTTDRPGAQALAWWLSDGHSWAALKVMTPREPGTRSASLPAAGYLVARDDWTPDAWYCAVDAGPHGGEATGHAHTDLAHVEIGRGSTRLVVDPGSLSYAPDPVHREWHRSERAHARPSVAGIELAMPNGPFGWRRVAPTPDWAMADDGEVWQCRLRYSYGERGRVVHHERQVALVRGMGVVVADWLTVPGATVRWHWPLDAAPEIITLGRDALRVNGLALHWRIAPAAPGAPTLESHRFAPSYASPRAGAVLAIDTPSTDRATAITCVLDAAAPPPMLEIMSEQMQCVLAGGRVSRTLVLAPGQAVRVTG
jgi:hypothetical protein